MITKEKKQCVEMGKMLQQDNSGKYRKALRDRIAELRHVTEQNIKTELDREERGRLEALFRAFIIADRILDKVFVSETHEMSGESRVKF